MGAGSQTPNGERRHRPVLLTRLTASLWCLGLFAAILGLVLYVIWQRSDLTSLRTENAGLKQQIVELQKAVDENQELNTCRSRFNNRINESEQKFLADFGKLVITIAYDERPESRVGNLQKSTSDFASAVAARATFDKNPAVPCPLSD